jgi:acyl carrier protein
VRECAAAVLGHESADELTGESQFVEAGFSSFTALEMCTRLGETLGVAVAPAVVYEYPTMAALAGHLRDQLREA